MHPAQLQYECGLLVLSACNSTHGMEGEVTSWVRLHYKETMVDLRLLQTDHANPTLPSRKS